MTQQALPSTTWRTIPSLAAIAFVPGTMLLQHWDPCDTTAAVTAGGSILHIGLCLVLGVLTCLGLALDPVPRQASPRRREAWIQRGLQRVCLLSILWLAVATLAVESRGNMRFAVNGFWQWTSMLVWSASIGVLASRPGFVRLVVTGMLAVGVGMLVYGYWEYGVIQPALRQQLEQSPAELFRRQGISPESSAALLLADRIRSTEMKGVYALANSLGGFLACLWILALGLWLSRKSDSVASTRSLLALGSMLPLLAAIAIGLLLTKSRTAWIAAGLGSLVLAILIASARGRLRSRTLVLGSLSFGAIAAVLTAMVYWFDPLIVQEAGKSLAYRVDYWRGACELIFRAPWFGYGVGGFQSTYLQVKLPTAAESPADPHNFLLETAHAGGLPCLVLVAIAIAATCWLASCRSSDQDCGPDDSPSIRAIRIAFWTGSALAVGGLLVWSVTTDSDEKLLGLLAAMACSVATALVLSLWPAAQTSVQSLVQSPSVLAIPLVVSLVHGLASGGWLLPGTMGMGLAGIGLAIGRAEGPARGGETEGRRFWGWLVVASVLLVAWYGTMALPVSRGMERYGVVLGGLAPNPSREQLRQLAAVDRWDPDLARLGMEWVANHLNQPMGKETRAEWEEVLRALQEAFVDRDPENALAWEACGQAAVRAAAATSDPVQRGLWLIQADRAFERTTALCPASAQWHLQAALAASWVGDHARSLEHCLQSEKIDVATPHRDRKISAARVFWPSNLLPRDPPLEDAARRGTVRDWVRAEPVLRYLRSQSQR